MSFWVSLRVWSTTAGFAVIYTIFCSWSRQETTVLKNYLKRCIPWNLFLKLCHEWAPLSRRKLRHHINSLLSTFFFITVLDGWDCQLTTKQVSAQLSSLSSSLLDLKMPHEAQWNLIERSSPHGQNTRTYKHTQENGEKDWRQIKKELSGSRQRGEGEEEVSSEARSDTTLLPRRNAS